MARLSVCVSLFGQIIQTFLVSVVVVQVYAQEQTASEDRGSIEGCYTKDLDVFLVLHDGIVQYQYGGFLNDTVDMFYRDDEELSDRVRFAAALESSFYPGNQMVRFDFQSSWTKSRVKSELTKITQATDISDIETHNFSYTKRANAELLAIYIKLSQSSDPGNTTLPLPADARRYDFIIEPADLLGDKGRFFRYYKSVQVVNILPQYQSLGTFHRLSVLCSPPCGKGWIGPRDFVNGTKKTCYRIYLTERNVNVFTVRGKCEYEAARPVTLETPEEFDYVQNLVFEDTHVQKRLANDEDVILFIGLLTTSQNFGVSHRWEVSNAPLYYNRWNPHTEFRELDECTAWTFSHTKSSNVSQSWWDCLPCYPGVQGFICESSETNFPEYTGIITANGTPHRSSLFVSSDDGSSSYFTSVSNFDYLSEMSSLNTFSFCVLAPSLCKDIATRTTLFANGVEIEKGVVPYFQCDKETSVAYSRVCDRVNDCPNSMDELVCPPDIPKTCGLGDLYCPSLNECIPKKRQCDFINDCPSGIDEAACDRNCRYFTCESKTCLPRSLLWDGIADCTGCTAEDELFVPKQKWQLLDACVMWCRGCIDITALADGKKQCTGDLGAIDEILGGLPAFNCTPDRTENTNNMHSWAPKCIYIRDEAQVVIGCRDLSHLENCESYTCPQKFYKCLGAGYCIPLAYVGNGVKDCLYGDDETPGQIIQNVFHCRGRFIDPSQVCDGHIDCEFGEDEDSCAPCPEGLICGSGAIVWATDEQLLDSPVLASLDAITHWIRYVNISGLDVSLIFPPPFNESHIQMSNLISIHMSKCGILTLHDGYDSITKHKGTYSRNYRKVIEADFSKNDVISIPKDSILSRMEMLKKLNLSSNVELSVIKNGALNCSKLTSLDLSWTALTEIPRFISITCKALEYLDLTGCPLVKLLHGHLPKSLMYVKLNKMPNLLELEAGVFRGMKNISSIETNQDGICCPVVLGEDVHAERCHAPKAPFSTCTDLVGEEVLRVLLWLMGAVACLGNISVLTFRVFRQRKTLRTHYGILVTHLNVADLLMGVYLLIIAGSDLRYRGTFVWEARHWMTSFTCKTAGYLSTLSLETSTSFIFLITLDRFLTLKYPLKGRIFSTVACHIVCAVTWAVTLAISAIPLFPGNEQWKIISSNAMCLSIPLMKAGDPGWIFASAVFVGTNSLFFVLIAAGQIAIYRAMKGNRMRTGQNALAAHRRQQEITVAKRLALVVISNFCCWLPIGIMSAVSLTGGRASQDAFAWSAILIMPLNSALNPVIYTLPAILYHFRSKSSSRDMTAANINTITAASPDRSMQSTSMNADIVRSYDHENFKRNLNIIFEKLSILDNGDSKVDQLSNWVKESELSDGNLKLLSLAIGQLLKPKNDAGTTGAEAPQRFTEFELIERL